jgi:MerR family transcriptional regulator, redox-sensitive transcriptional activator SoxR
VSIVELLSIGQAAFRTGVPASTLRYYDRMGLVPATGRAGGKRRYDRQALQRVRAVGLCQRAGFTLEEIARLLDGRPPWQGLARQKLVELEGRIDDLRRAIGLLGAALDCGCRRLEACGRAAHLAEVAADAPRRVGSGSVQALSRDPFSGPAHAADRRRAITSADGPARAEEGAVAPGPVIFAVAITVLVLALLDRPLSGRARARRAR